MNAAKYVLVTGISTGIGYAVTSMLIQNGYFVFGTVRNSQQINSLKVKWPSAFKAIMMDITDSQQVEKAKQEIREYMKGAGLYAIINNAGIAVQGPVLNIPIEKIQYQLEVNVVGQIRVIQAFWDLIIKDNQPDFPHRILNISSVSALFTWPFVGPYSASKKALEGFLSALRYEASLFNVKIISIQPGPIKTEIWNKAAKSPDYFLGTDFESFSPLAQKAIYHSEKNAIPSNDLARFILDILNKANPKSIYVFAKRKWTYKLIPFIPTKIINLLIERKLNKFR